MIEKSNLVQLELKVMRYRYQNDFSTALRKKTIWGKIFNNVKRKVEHDEIFLYESLTDI